MTGMKRALRLLPLAVLALALAGGTVACKKDQPQAPAGTEAGKEGQTPQAQPTQPAAGTEPAGTPTAQPTQPGQPAQPGATAAAPDRKTGPTDEKVTVEFYVMSKCPFGVRVEDAFAPVLDKMGANIDFKLEFIADALPDGTFKALHGEPEVQGNIAQLCARQHHPDKYMKLVSCMNKNMRDIPSNWEACATESGLDMEKMKACYAGDEGKQLLKASAELAKTKGARGSPTMFFGGQRYSGGRSETSFMRAVCNGFKGVQPEACASLPAPVAVNLTILTDERCKECRTEPMEARIKSMFEGVTIKKLDYGTPEGKEIFGKLSQKLLPVFLFDKTVEQAESYEQLKRYMVPEAEFLSLRVGAKFDPTAEICDNKIDDTNDGAVDCDDATCKDTLTCRAEAPKKLDLFVMSQCPYGVKALNAMKEVFVAFEGEIDFQVHFIADEVGDGQFKALHGQPEVDENIRELCAIKHYGEGRKYMDYVWCRNENIRSDAWQECTGEKTGIDAKVIETCFAGEEGKQLLRDSIKVTKALGFSASPTWLANNKYKFSGISAEQIKQSFCRYNQGLKGCEKSLSDDKAVQGSCGG